MKFARNCGIKNNKRSRTYDTIDFRQPILTIMIKLASRVNVRCNAYAYIRVDDVSGTSALVSTRVRKTTKSDN